MCTLLYTNVLYSCGIIIKHPVSQSMSCSVLFKYKYIFHNLHSFFCLRLHYVVFWDAEYDSLSVVRVIQNKSKGNPLFTLVTDEL